MISYDNAKNMITNVLNGYNFEERVRDEYFGEICGDRVNIILLKTSVTGTERPKPQIRAFTERIVSLANRSFSNNERFFCFIHCSHERTMLKFDNLQPDEYIVSLESDWNTAGGRIDVRSIYDRLANVTNPTYLKINSSQHSATSVRQAAVFKLDDSGLEYLQQYLRFFDSRLISQLSNTPEIEPETTLESEDDIAEARLVAPGINKIYFGAPGTGKSFSIQTFIRNNGISEYVEKSGHPNVFRSTLHPEFTYYDFVGQVMPKVSREEDSSGTVIEYDFVPKIFTTALARAFEVKESEPVFLILEEMSRANVAAVFGDLFQLLDREVESGESEYRIYNDLIAYNVFKNEKSPIFLPGNLFIVGTVNTNDQNVFVMDTAFKRRFEFEYVPADNIAKNAEERVLNNFQFELEEEGTPIQFEWVKLYQSLNRFITKKVDAGGLGLKEDKQLGQFFIKFRENDSEYNKKQLSGKLLQYLYEDIESAAYADNISLFKVEIQSFSTAYRYMNEGKNIFSVLFLQEYNLQRN